MVNIKITFGLEEAKLCARNYIARERMCAGCSFDTRCGIYSMMKELKDYQREQFLLSLQMGDDFDD